MTLGSRYDRLYDNSIPPDFGRETLRVLARHHELSWDFVEERWQEPEAHDLLGDVRRANIEQDWRSIATRTPGLIASVERTAKGGSHYTIVKAGRIWLTVSCVEAQTSMPRVAEFRRRNAENRQLNLLDSNATVSDADDVYAIIVHGGLARRLAFAFIAFPDRSCESWLHQVDLRRKYPDTWNDLYPQPGLGPPVSPTLRSEHDRA